MPLLGAPVALPTCSILAPAFRISGTRSSCRVNSISDELRDPGTAIVSVTSSLEVSGSMLTSRSWGYTTSCAPATPKKATSTRLTRKFFIEYTCCMTVVVRAAARLYFMAGNYHQTTGGEAAMGRLVDWVL